MQIPMEHAHTLSEASAWVKRWARLIPAGGTVLDVAAGSGRHALYFARLGYRVEAVDRDAVVLQTLAGAPGVTVRVADLEGGPWPYAGRRFEGIVVTHYLHRPLFPCLLEALGERGVLIYETFAVGNERYGRPSNPAFLLRPGELLAVFGSALQVVAYEAGRVSVPKPAVLQRLCAVRCAEPVDLEPTQPGDCIRAYAAGQKRRHSVSPGG
jgi:SAM-dependent methyltransferase